MIFSDMEMEGNGKVNNDLRKESELHKGVSGCAIEAT